jgi:branched-chain amino acid transport system permease protein
MAGDTDTRSGALAPTALPPRHVLGLLGLALVAVLPVVVRDITLLKVTGALYFAVFAMSWDVVSGYTGQISFGHALFFGVGGYTAGMLNIHHGVDPLLTIPVGVVAAMVAGVVIGVPALRVHGPYLSLITLVAPIILLRTFVFFSDWTGGEIGLVGIEALVDGVLANYYLAFALFVVVLAVLLAVTRSDAGSVFTAIRADEQAVSASGIDPAKFKIFAFVLSAAVGGLAGGMLAHSIVGSVTPSQLLALAVSIEVIIATILGGMGTIVGAAAGGMLLYLLRDALRNLSELVIPVGALSKGTPLPPRIVVDMVVPAVGIPLKEIDLLLFSLITLGFLFFVPDGLVPRGIRYGRRLDARVRGGAAATDGGRTPLASTLARFGVELRRLLGGDDE